MPCRGSSPDSFAALTLAVMLAAVLVLGSACDVDSTNVKHLSAFAPIVEVSPFIGTSIFPSAVVVSPVFGIGCPFFPAFGTNFTLVITVSGKSDQFLRETTFRLLDGTHRGATPLVVSTSDLEGKFGPTVIRAGTTRSFPFAPQFGCGTFSPTSLAADVVLLDSQGMRHDSTVVVPIGGR
jgi:hypothetical protein